MKILYFHQHFSTSKGAVASRSFAMASALTAAGHDVHVICGSYQSGDTGIEEDFTGGSRSAMIEGFRVTEFELPYSNNQTLFERSGMFLSFAFRSMRVAVTNDYDLAFCSSTPLTAALPGIAARWLRHRKFVFEVRDLWPELPREMGVIKNPVILGLLSALEWCGYRSASGCIGLSPGIVEGIKRRAHARTPVVLIPNGCDLDLFTAQNRTARSADGESRPFTAVFTGTHGLANGLDAVLDAAGELKRREICDIRLLFIGGGACKPRLVQRALDEGLDNCEFLDPIPKPVLARRMQTVDVGLMVLKNVPAFYYGTSPNKFFDYLSTGLPVINNYPGWLADLIDEYRMGIAVAPDDPAAFADALERLAADPEGAVKMGARARQLGENQFDRHQLAEQLVAFVEQIKEPRRLF